MISSLRSTHYGKGHSEREEGVHSILSLTLLPLSLGLFTAPCPTATLYGKRPVNLQGSVTVDSQGSELGKIEPMTEKRNVSKGKGKEPHAFPLITTLFFQD